MSEQRYLKYEYVVRLFYSVFSCHDQRALDIPCYPSSLRVQKSSYDTFDLLPVHSAKLLAQNNKKPV